MLCCTVMFLNSSIIDIWSLRILFNFNFTVSQSQFEEKAAFEHERRANFAHILLSLSNFEKNS